MAARIAIAVMALALAGCGNLQQRSTRPYKAWADYCMQMAIRKHDSDEGLRCLEAAEQSAELEVYWKMAPSTAP